MKALTLAALLALSSVSSYAAEARNGWRDVISSQIEAFRDEDGATALDLAGAGFKAQFDDPDVFYDAIIAAGYGPIATSRSHSFGEAVEEGDTVAQVVRFTGNDQTLHEAVYTLAREADGWRVQGVVMRRAEGLGI